MYAIVTSKAFDKRLNGLTRQWRDRILRKIAAIAEAPYAPHPNVTKLQGRDGYRLRIGDWRVIYELDDGRFILLALELDTRGGIY
jgi:mRNA interferase RelE/StbE